MRHRESSIRPPAIYRRKWVALPSRPRSGSSRRTIPCAPVGAWEVVMSDGGESARPTLDDLWRHRSAEAAFPAALVQDAQTVGSFFSASFYGRNDVIFLNHLKVPDILLVDTDRLKLAAMAKI